MDINRSGAVFRSEGSPSNPKDLCHFLFEVKDVCRKHRRSFGFKGLPSDLKTAPDLIKIDKVFVHILV